MKSTKLIKLFIEDKPVAIVIILNAIVLFLLAFDELSNFHNLLNFIDSAFLIYFILEAILKIRESGWKKYIASNWNRFDFVIVLVSIPSIIISFSSDELIFGNKLTFLFVFRILRIFRFFKFLTFIPDIEELIAGIRRAMKASVFVILVFFIYMFLVSMISCQMFKNDSKEHFGDPLISLYSIFKVFTVEGWYEVPDAITKNQSRIANFFTKFYFVIIVVSGGLFGLSIVNAIFVEEMVRDNNDDLIREVDQLHKKLDILLAQNGQRGSPVSLSNPDLPTDS